MQMIPIAIFSDFLVRGVLVLFLKGKMQLMKRTCAVYRTVYLCLVLLLGIRLAQRQTRFVIDAFLSSQPISMNGTTGVKMRLGKDTMLKILGKDLVQILGLILGPMDANPVLFVNREI